MPYKGTDAEKKAVREYQKRQDNIMIRPSKEEGARIRSAAAEAGKSVQAFILDILREHIK
jgi:predicted DNA binding CopG/RHH family protein|nr:MAG TPA: NikA, BACTERIAL CONJUGATION, RELAXASE, DNA [Caudoviricetes sp.]DAT40731.1 MAG TPA: NikA, BACTERIAL CONJUGATION, RELAXASE, DNA [Caudoviricetes sp.]DAW49206.1 MAG TPA: NikA, BACTERIAL CONJUGATION, RELAXASE, DNA [Caudoviricetes sp.]